MRRLFLIILLWIFPFLAFCQGEFNNWIWGTGSYVSWNTGVPVLQPPTGLFFTAGGATVSDSAGTLLFYCDGWSVRNKNLVVMPHGMYLNGGNGSFSQGVISIQDQSHPKKHFIFTVGGATNPRAEYTVVDMILDGGLGDVDISQKNLPLRFGGNASNGINGTRSDNNKDAWIVVKKNQADSNYYLSYKIISTGLINMPVLSPSAYRINSSVGQYSTNQIKISHDGKYLVTNFYLDTLEICNFNNSTGYVTSKFLVHLSGLATQIEFSPDSRFLYFIQGDKVRQADMSIEDSAQFVQHIIDVSTAYNHTTSLQAAVDGKIYIGKEQLPWLSVINNPNAPGIACNFVNNAFGINDPCLSQGFPDFVQRYKAYFHPDTSCMMVNFTSDIWPPADSIIWNFGDPASGTSNTSDLPNPVHLYPAPGTYQVMLYVRHNDNRHDTTWKTVVIQPTPQPQLGPDQSVCNGNSVLLNPGSFPGCTYQWTNLTTGLQVGTGPTYTATQTGIYEVVITGVSGCFGADTIQITTGTTPLVTNNQLSDTICSGETTNIPLTANVPGTVFHWVPSLISGTVTGFAADSGTVIGQTLNNPGPGNGVVVYHITPKNSGCVGPVSDFFVTVTPGIPVTVAISVDEDTVCTGSAVHFTAVSNPSAGSLGWQWKVNGVNSGANQPVFDYVPANNDIVTCSLTVSNATCLSNNPATSVPITLAVNPLIPVSVSVTASANPVCSGTQVTFTATSSPAAGIHHYQWKINGVNAGMDQPSFNYIPLNGDVITCVTTVTGLNCLTGSPSTSQPVTMIVNSNVALNLTITASFNPVCSGIPVTFTAAYNPTGGTNHFQWMVNGMNAGSDQSAFTYNPVNTEVVSCILSVTGNPCASNNPAASNQISMNVIASPVVSFIRCNDSVTTVNAKPFKIKGAIPLNGTFSGPGVNSLTGIFSPSLAGAGLKTINYSYTNIAGCSDSKTLVIDVRPAALFTCGSVLTDLRDGQVYSTVQIGSQCWFAEDLRYGTYIPPSQHQRDNCIPEKYQSAAGSQQSAVYQWDEVMTFNQTAVEQGLCPASWHVPSEPEWQTLFSNYTNNAFAGAALKYSGFSGFTALLTGIIPHNTTLQFYQFATFYWTSTAYGPYKAWAHGMNTPDFSVSVYPSSRQNAFAVRCVKD